MNKKYYHNYLKTQAIRMKYIKDGKIVPPEIEDKCDFALIQLRIALDESGYRIPPTLYIYDSNDKRTWKFLNGKVTSCVCYTEVLNPDFIFRGF